MFYAIIKDRRDKWLNSSDCYVSDLIRYMAEVGKMRDAQIDAIKTFLFLKLKCRNKPLWELFATGEFNSLVDFDSLEVSTRTREELRNNPAALALWQYATIKNEDGSINAPMLEREIRNNPQGIDYEGVIRSLFFNVDYPDYLFSIPMGAGKTFLMAAFIYLNLYFALNEPDNPLFAHNFIIFVPSGLKTSIIPSLRDIQNFDPKWIIPDPVASQLKALVKFEWLQEDSSASKTNTVRNPNARKVSMYTSRPGLMGLVAVTNAEKVILDKVDKNFSIDETLWRTLPESERKELEEAKMANELREHIGRIPNLCILIDEVHHASEDQQLRRVVNNWMRQESFNSVLGFSGTPYMDPAYSVPVSEAVTLKIKQYSNVVIYYPLIEGLGNFLKIPVVRHANLDSAEIIDHGLREFFDKYMDVRYSKGSCAKVAIYAPNIASLEEDVFPQVASICAEYGLNPGDVVLKYHRGDSKGLYKPQDDAQLEFASLDSPLSKKRIILLVQIGREGWNCKSLASIILSQRNACPQNMVLQTSCRCLREVDSAASESALIWLNKFNADKLNDQLKKQQYTTLEAFGSVHPRQMMSIERFDRTATLNLPSIDYCQFKVNYAEVTVDDDLKIFDFLSDYNPPLLDATLITTQNLRGEAMAFESASGYGVKQSLSLAAWLQMIVKESCGTLSLSSLEEFRLPLQAIFDKIPYSEDKSTYLKDEFNHTQIRSDIRKAFVPRRDFNVQEELIPQEARLLSVSPLPSPIEVPVDARYIPSQIDVKKIVEGDSNPDPNLTPEVIAYLKAHNIPIPDPWDSNKYKRAYHYLPYHLDSSFEDRYYRLLLSMIADNPQVEAYFNGDESLTDFKIRCYSRSGRTWRLLGDYYPDFLLLTRTPDNKIRKVVIVETKGEGFSAKFAPRREFMRDTFIRLNNEHFGYPRFEFLYLEDTESEETIQTKTYNIIRNFLND